MPKQHYKPDSFHLRDSVGYLIKRAQRLAQEQIETRFEEQGCTLQQWVVLMHVRDKIAVTIADLCRELYHDSGAMTRLIDQLEARKFIERRRNADDRRVIELSLTHAGEKALDSLIPIACDTLNTALDGFTRDEVKTLQSLLRRMIGGLEGSLSANKEKSS
ncbi:winged helix-turn-helix transcriptional regulator [Steroidobacter sp. S1-65]|uniref:Winged helix-turn-helix transcriptional regulator n=1 Tax=Steroidobacter gossypii TaxID=2805490 RepID=A0ABS1WRI5_9GAMM|nr:MarR family winged helix-turn-helix transcriptional regulator [Steroidobacter gossypii]MBM0103591.1 winged helix-turn-helix transcriptional regulator [Steroidobacter gossypii]